jgi:hypothetical protein
MSLSFPGRNSHAFISSTKTKMKSRLNNRIFAQTCKYFTKTGNHLQAQGQVFPGPFKSSFSAACGSKPFLSVV